MIQFIFPIDNSSLRPTVIRNKWWSTNPLLHNHNKQNQYLFCGWERMGWWLWSQVWEFSWNRISLFWWGCFWNGVRGGGKNHYFLIESDADYGDIVDPIISFSLWRTTKSVYKLNNNVTKPKHREKVYNTANKYDLIL